MVRNDEINLLRMNNVVATCGQGLGCPSAGKRSRKLRKRELLMNGEWTTVLCRLLITVKAYLRQDLGPIYTHTYHELGLL